MEAKLIINICILLICGVSVIFDLIKWKIPNIWLYSWSTAGILYRVLGTGVENSADALMGIALPILILGVFFYFRMIGAGDIKLFSCLGVWIGAESVLLCMLFSFGAAAIMSAIHFWVHKNLRERFLYFLNYLGKFWESKVKTDYEVKKAGKARMHLSIPILIGVIIKVIGVY